MTLISLNINSAVGLKDIYARISYWLTAAGFKVTCLWEDYAFVDSIQGDERERLLRLCKTKRVACIAYGEGIVVVPARWGKGMEKSIREYKRLKKEKEELEKRKEPK
jgi:hypothetical protein